jgi:hypothetical protein
VHLGSLLASGAAYLEATQGLFPSLLDRVAREELGIARQDLRAADLSRLWKAPHLAQYFDRSLELKALAKFLQGIGLDLRTAAGTEVRMSFKPVGGLDDYWTLFHEAGHAVHFASATVEPKELVTLGHGAPSEAFGEIAPALRLLGHPDKAAADLRELYRELLSAAAAARAGRLVAEADALEQAK